MASIIIVAKKFSKKFHEKENLHLTIQSSGEKKTNLDTILEILKVNCDVVNLRRFDETKETIEVSFMIEVQNFTQLNNVKNELQNINDTMKITFLDNKGLL